jgi:hypothetical protein
MSRSGGLPEDSFSLIQPLLRCTRLAKLRMMVTVEVSDPSLNLQNAHIEAMGKAWPALEHLEFTCELEEGAPLDPSLTLQAIPILCARCPKLQYLRLSMDAQNCPPPPVDPMHGLLATTLRTVDFSGSTIRDAAAVAAWLGDLCPADAIEVPPHDISGLDVRPAMWRDVKKRVEALQTARRVERRRIHEGMLVMVAGSLVGTLVEQ